MRNSLRRRVAAGVAAASAASVLALGAATVTAPVASADTPGYGRVVIDQLWRPYFNFGIPAWVTSNKGSREAAKGACAAYLGDRLGLRWWMWWAPDVACGYVVDQVWSPNNGTAVCGSIPLRDVRGTRVWSC
ncbi:hypothetical protein [Nocardia blacklockiae]|uniref:hypothetical protein n=1 Tax=Nocardia blacklockiae TaxID=480036 RepID=UPI0018960814|nr:hypothetical protein [Nocardia blacklockiae]MBF6173621.1 hypothetical protein [Nocardia blacklockiae]